MTDDDIRRALAYAIADTLTALLQPMPLGDALAARAKRPLELDTEDRHRIAAVIAALRAAFILANNAGRHDLVGQFFEAYRALMKVLEPAKAIPPLEQCWDAAGHLRQGGSGPVEERAFSPLAAALGSS